MLSYMLPVEEKSPTSRNLSLNLNLTNNNNNNNQINCMNGGSNGGGGGSSSSNGINNCINGTTTTTASTITTATSTNYDSGNLINNILLSEKINNKLNIDNNIKNNIIDDGNILSNMTTATTNITQNKINGIAGDIGNNGIIVTTGDETSSRKIKMGKMSSTKNAPLKRVSFGSSKGSMVETLVFETPTPLPEHAEREFCFQPTDILAKTHNNSSFLQNGSCLDDSGIEMMQEELERSKVRVTFYQSSKPQQISPPPELQYKNNLNNNNFINFIDNNNLIIFGGGGVVGGNGVGGVGGCGLIDEDIDNCFINNKDLTKEEINLLKMSAAVATNGGQQILTTTTTTTTTTYDRQISTESGWDNPFRPGGDLSREADEIVNLIKGGKPITPTGDVNQIIGNGDANKKDTHVTENGTTVIDGATKIDVSQTQSGINGTRSPQKGGNNNGLIKDGLAKNGVNNDTPTSATTTTTPQTQTQISNQVIPGPQSASHVIIDDKKKKKCTCCVIQ